jgi:hypothetical protein
MRTHKLIASIAVATCLMGVLVTAGASAQAATAVTWNSSMVTSPQVVVAPISNTQGYVLTAADLRADYPGLTDAQWASLTVTVSTNGVSGPGTVQTDSSGNFVSYTLPANCGTRNWAAFVFLSGPAVDGPLQVGMLHIFENDAVCSYRVPVAASFASQTSMVSSSDLLKSAGAGRIDPAFPGIPTYYSDVWPALSLADASTWTFTTVNTHPQVRLLTATPGAVVATDAAGNIASITPATPSTGYTVTYSLSTATGLFPTTVGTITYTPGATGPTAPAAPTVTALEPDHGPTAGGNNVSISGTNFDPACTVTFDGAPAYVSGSNDTLINVIAPAHSEGPIDVVVTCGGASTEPIGYTYDAPVVLPSPAPEPPAVADPGPPAPATPPTTPPVSSPAPKPLPVVSG